MKRTQASLYPSRKTETGAYQYEIEPGRWVCRERVRQLRASGRLPKRVYLSTGRKIA